MKPFVQDPQEITYSKYLLHVYAEIVWFYVLLNVFLEIKRAKYL